MADENVVIEFSMKGVTPEIAGNYRKVVKDMERGVRQFNSDTSAKAENYTKESRFREGALHYQPSKPKRFK